MSPAESGQQVSEGDDSRYPLRGAMDDAEYERRYLHDPGFHALAKMFRQERAAREAAERHWEDAKEMNASNCQRANRAERHADGLRRAVERVRAVHSRAADGDTSLCAEDGHVWPCRTIRNLDSPAEGETDGLPTYEELVAKGRRVLGLKPGEGVGLDDGDLTGPAEGVTT